MVIRPATANDYEAVRALFPELRVDEPFPPAARWANDSAPNTLVAEHDRAVLGFTTFYRLSDAGYVRNLVTAPHARGQGVGAALMHAAAARLRASGVTEWQLNVDCDNGSARRLYERLGMKPEDRTTALRFAWDRLAGLPRATAAATVLPLAETEDADVERVLGLLDGRIAMARHRSPAGQFLQLRDAGCAAVGFACFDATCARVMPFRVARPELAVLLLEAIRPHTTEATFLLVIDDDDALVDLLITAGAEVRMRLLNLRGPLPDSQPDRAA